MFIKKERDPKTSWQPLSLSLSPSLVWKLLRFISSLQFISRYFPNFPLLLGFLSMLMNEKMTMIISACSSPYIRSFFLSFLPSKPKMSCGWGEVYKVGEVGGGATNIVVII